MAYNDIVTFEPSMQMILELHNMKFSGLNPEFCGMEETAPCHSWGPGFRSQYHLHFIISGKGFFENAYGRYELSAGQGFFFIPGERIYYESYAKDPLVYIWFGFSGNNMETISRYTGLSSSNPIFNFDSSFNIEEEFAILQYMKSGREFYSLSILSRFFSILDNKDEAPNASKIETAKDYIVQNISEELSVNFIAKRLHIDRRYFSKIFSRETGTSPQQFIINTRMATALDLLKNRTNITVGDVSRSVDYSDPLAFSKAFKKYYGLSPSEVIRGKRTDYMLSNFKENGQK